MIWVVLNGLRASKNGPKVGRQRLLAALVVSLLIHGFFELLACIVSLADDLNRVKYEGVKKMRKEHNLSNHGPTCVTFFVKVLLY